MLQDLHIRNLAVLSEASVQFEAGLNVLTGETGAGKSIIVDGLSLLAGARANNDLIRTGADSLTVTGRFRPSSTTPSAVSAEGSWREVLETAGLEVDDDELVVVREVSREGRNRVFINNQPATLRLLTEIAPHLLQIHSQHEELGLVSPEYQRAWLDQVGVGRSDELLGRCAATFETYRALLQRLERASGSEQLRHERVDLLKFQISEIGNAHLEAGEEEGLRAERDTLRHSEHIQGALLAALALLAEDEGAAADRLAQGHQHIQEIVEWESEGNEWAAELNELRIRTEEVAASLRRRAAHVRSDPKRLDQVEDRLAEVERLARKYGSGSREILNYYQHAGKELEELQQDSNNAEELSVDLARALQEYREAAVELSQERRVWGELLAERVHQHLEDLAMEKARFEVGLSRRKRGDSPLVISGEPVEFSALGFDTVGFQLSANPGEEIAPLSRIASGGELSRVYLALQLAVRGSGQARPSTLIFDEVDSGIGGAEADALGSKLKRLASGGQILAVTHLPQVASFADRHFKVGKRLKQGRTHAFVKSLGSEDRVEEIARMLAGKTVTEVSRVHAREMIQSGRGSGR